MGLLEDARVWTDGAVSEYRQQVEDSTRKDESTRKDGEGASRGRFTQSLTQLHAALLLAERRDEAADVARKLLATLDTPESRLALVRAGLDIVQRAEPCFAQWLGEAEKAGANTRSLRKRLEWLGQKAPAKGE